MTSAPNAMSASRVPACSNMSIDADPQLQEAASPQMLVVRSSSR